jgi:archaellin
LKKFMLLAAIVALVLVAIAPALAQVGTEVGQEEIESGDAEGSTAVSNKGDLTNQCVTSGNFTNSGNATATAGVSQYQTGTDDIEISGSTIEFGGGIAGECTQTIEVK